MSQHPTVVHWAADRHRQEMLAEAATDRRTPGTGRSAMAFTRLAQHLVRAIASVASRLVDEFEPLPGRQHASAGRLPGRMRS